MHVKVIGQTWIGFIEAYAQSLRADCDLNQATRFLFATYCLIMIIICAKLFSNPTMHDKVMGRAWTGFTGLCTKFKCRLWHWPLTKRHGTCSWHIVLSWWSFVPNYFQISSCTAMALTRFWNTRTHTHSHGQVRLYMPFPHLWRGHKNPKKI